MIILMISISEVNFQIFRKEMEEEYEPEYEYELDKEKKGI